MGFSALQFNPLTSQRPLVSHVIYVSLGLLQCLSPGLLQGLSRLTFAVNTRDRTARGHHAESRMFPNLNQSISQCGKDRHSRSERKQTQNCRRPVEKGRKGALQTAGKISTTPTLDKNSRTRGSRCNDHLYWLFIPFQ